MKLEEVDSGYYSRSDYNVVTLNKRRLVLSKKACALVEGFTHVHFAIDKESNGKEFFLRPVKSGKVDEKACKIVHSNSSASIRAGKVLDKIGVTDMRTRFSMEVFEYKGEFIFKCTLIE